MRQELPIVVQFHRHKNLTRTACSVRGLAQVVSPFSNMTVLDLIRLAVTDSADQKRGNLTLLVLPY